MKVLPSLLLLGAGVVGGAASPHAGAPNVSGAKKATYSDNVAKILNDRCVSCHRAGQVAPFSLEGYANAKKWSKSVALVVDHRQMPPWKAVPGFGQFKDENRLTDAEIETLQSWADAGAPAGSGKPPAPPKFSSAWTLGDPDLVLTTAKPYRLGPEGTDEYRNFVFKTNFKETRWVRAMDVRPGNTKVVHHVIAYLDKGANAAKLESKHNDGQEGYVSAGGGVGFMPSGALGGWAPGVRAQNSTEGTAFKLEPGTTIVMQVHYHRSGKPETDQTKMALYFAKEPPQRELILDWALDWRLNIPAGAKEYKMRFEREIPVDVTVYNTMPHMHLLGRKMKSWFETPDGRKLPLIQVDDWDFNWQLVYTLKTPMKVPAGSKHIIEAAYDNSTSNPRNPNDPPKRVTWGEQTTDEMFLLITSYTIDAMDKQGKTGFMLGRPARRVIRQ